MKRTVNVAGALLTVAGMILLAYVGVSWVQSRQGSPAQASASSWSAAEQAKGREIASTLGNRVQDASFTTGSGPPPGSEPAARIIIPRIGVNAPVVETAPVAGVWEVADWAVGHLSTSPNPGGVGNNALSAHDDIKGEVFKRLGELQPGDQVQLRTRHAVYVYVVTDQLTVDPSDVSVLNQSPKAIVTLISCEPYWVDTQRLVVQALLKSRQAIA
ncbi:MAG: sortase [Chloroflexota bacterium]|nr:MAG: hypothetical protein DLM70_14225 [Chloroflexota bacterium]